jgi:hypothetical protein
MGAVVAFCTFGAGNAAGGSGAPDTHLFRVENGKLRYVHTLTHLCRRISRAARWPEDVARRSGGARHWSGRPDAAEQAVDDNLSLRADIHASAGDHRHRETE